ncbi:MAG: glycosyltransferase [Paracoccus sp. (in: a-proteobacteria)]|uniref:glycosyltransferase n=1 Tax=Paracoccus sp. TaxID=267 RepID=UPI0026DEEA45|nr:glycosyltransferase [Paracoccus sp. (in: a-proteobacteria)]MDO5632228.1 glycosyltransferase [Paracoccus sp. (in: a-proteobacteria)]
MRIQVLGLCRFSLLTQSDFQTTGADLDRNRAILYDPVRLDLRMRWFENLCLPPLLWQTDPDFTLIVATGEDLPQPWLGHLRDIAEAVPQIRLMQAPPGLHAPICRDMLAQTTEPGADVVAQFRMDDDDAVAQDYVASVRQDYHAIKGLMDGWNPVALDYGRGLLVQADDDDLHISCALTHFWAPGLTLYFPGGEPRSVMNYRHDWVWRLTPTATKIDRVMWMRGFHGHNDSPHHLGKRIPVEMTQAQVHGVMLRRFGLEHAALREALTGASGAFVSPADQG